jgi:hypothetical protein
MKIIFLDIDGVLNVIPQGFDKYGGIFHDHFVKNLEYIINKTNAKIVISSTWKLMGLDTIKQMWIDRNLPGNIIDITPNNFNIKRGHEIQQWINDNNIKCYCIIDDDVDMLPSQMNNFVRTSYNYKHKDCIDIGYGLTKICSNQVVSILNKC